MCLWKGLGVQATGMSGRRPQFAASVQLISYATGITSGAFYINMSTASRFQPSLQENTHPFELDFFSKTTSSLFSKKNGSCRHRFFYFIFLKEA